MHFYNPPLFLNLAMQISEMKHLLKISSISLLTTLVMLIEFFGGLDRMRSLLLNIFLWSLHSEHAILFSVA